MRIVIDLQGAQTESRFRGIGRYTLSFAQGVVRNRGEHEIILALSGLFPETIKPIRAAFDGLLPQENIRVWHAPGPLLEQCPDNESRREVAELLREAFLACLQPDVIHISSLFEGYVDDAVTSIGRFDRETPVSVSLYDLIPLLNPDQYLKPNPCYQQYYRRKINHLRHAACWLAISEFARQEGAAYLDVPEDWLVNVSTAIEPHFQPLVVDADIARQFHHKFDLVRPFVLYSGGSDERKNLPRLIQAYAALPSALRQSHQLLFAGKMAKGDIAQFRQVASESGLDPDELGFTGYVSEEELVLFYNLCALFVFPSWHEGFGLPALEAMACGAPVIGANTSSLPEVIGFEEALFDPMDVNSISTKMQRALTNASFQNRLREHGLQRAKLFSWDETAKRAIETWERRCQVSTQNTRSAERSWLLIRQRIESIYTQLIDGVTTQTESRVSLADDELKQLAVCIARNERQIDSFIRARPLPEKVVWRIEGPFDSSYSLALVNREMARAMSGLGHKVVLHSTEGQGDFLPNEQFLAQNPDMAEMHRLASKVAQEESDVTSRNLYPPRVADMNSPLNFFHGYAWEESAFPSEWVESFNTALQGMTVTSRHVKKIMIDNGVMVPIMVTGNGVNHWERIQPDAGIRIDGRSFRFLHVSSCFPRKGVDKMLEAYGRAFSSDDDVTLVVKTFPNPHNEIYRWLEEAKSRNTNFPDVLILEGDYTDAQLKGLYEQCHALVAPSRAEGFGLPMAEAMLSELAVIATGWSGQLDFCTPATSWLVDYRFERARTHFGLFSSVWAEPDVGHLAKIMRDVYEAPEEELTKRIGAGRELLLKNFRWAHVAQRTVDAARKWSRFVDRPEPRIGWVTTWNTRCGIATYSEHLVTSMPGQVKILAPKASEFTAKDQGNVSRCWVTGDTDTLQELNDAIEKSCIDTLVVQFNYGFFDLEILSNFLVKQIEEGRIVVVMMHATIDPVNATHKKLSILTPALARCQRILVHSPNDMNRLKIHGLIDNVALFPHGVIDFVPQTEVKPQNAPFVIASYGFFLPHKGLLELIKAVAILRSEGLAVELRMINAEYPVPESRALIDQARHLVKRHGIEDVVSICTDFLDDEASLCRLAEANLVIFPYQDTGESASGAVRYGMASRCTVAVTPLPIFEDVWDATFHLPGCSPQDIADGIKDFVGKYRENSVNLAKIFDMADKWRIEHRYSSVAARLFNMLSAIAIDNKLSGCHIC